ENTGVVTTLNQEPTEDELEKLFAQYRTTLPDPISPTPGFRIPEKFRLEFFLADVSENTVAGKYYQRAYDAQLLLEPDFATRETQQLLKQYLDNKEIEYKRITAFAIVPAGPPDKPTRYEMRFATGRMDDPATAAAVHGHFLAALA